ncbi:lytic transglycosylase domain-containing protein [Vibrio mimicus]
MKTMVAVLLLLPNLAAAFCFDEAGQYYNVNPKLLKSIAQVESSLNPNAYNENRNAKGEIVSRDYGLMQINSSQFPGLSQFEVNENTVYEPCFNVYLGAWVLSSNFASHGYNWNSVGAYNAGFKASNKTARMIYIKKVQREYYKN